MRITIQYNSDCRFLFEFGIRGLKNAQFQLHSGLTLTNFGQCLFVVIGVIIDFNYSLLWMKLMGQIFHTIMITLSIYICEIAGQIIFSEYGNEKVQIFE